MQIRTIDAFYFCDNLKFFRCYETATSLQLLIFWLILKLSLSPKWCKLKLSQCKTLLQFILWLWCNKCQNVLKLLPKMWLVMKQKKPIKIMTKNYNNLKHNRFFFKFCGVIMDVDFFACFDTIIWCGNYFWEKSMRCDCHLSKKVEGNSVCSVLF